VSGLINIETTLKIDAFPLPYFPVSYAFNAVNMTVSGVGYNVARALSTLGSPVRLMSILGRDESGEFARHTLKANSISPYAVIDGMERTACSVILYDGDGKREIHVDLKDIQEQSYPLELFEQAAAKSDIMALCNINFSSISGKRAARSSSPRTQ
jgi:ribokinase